MIWLLLTTQFGTFANSMRQQNEFLPSSLHDAVRVGATIFSRFLNQKPSRFQFSGFYDFNDEFHPPYKGTRKGGEGQKNGFILTVLRLMGVDPRKINDFAFDGYISTVSLMSRVLLKEGGNGRNGRKAPRDFSFFRFILGQRQVADLLGDIENPNVVDLLLKESIEKLKHFPEENVECIHLLICKMKPFVRGMQRSLRFFMKRENLTISGGEETCPEETREEGCQRGGEDARWEEESLEGRMYFFLPGLREVIEEGDECDQLFPNCVY